MVSIEVFFFSFTGQDGCSQLISHDYISRIVLIRLEIIKIIVLNLKSVLIKFDISISNYIS